MNHDDRLQSRRMQTQGWLAPLPDPTIMPVALDAARIRVEWDTRDSMSQRHFAAIQNKGPTAVTAVMLHNHPTHGAEPFMPLSGRQDDRPYHVGPEPPFFPDPTKPTERPMLPPRTLYAHPFLEDVDQSDHNVPREFRTVVKEENRTRGEDIATRIAGRTFTNQWMTAARDMSVRADSLDHLSIAEQLRPKSDDWRVDYGTGSQ